MESLIKGKGKQGSIIIADDYDVPDPRSLKGLWNWASRPVKKSRIFNRRNFLREMAKELARSIDNQILFGVMHPNCKCVFVEVSESPLEYNRRTRGFLDYHTPSCNSQVNGDKHYPFKEVNNA